MGDWVRLHNKLHGGGTFVMKSRVVSLEKQETRNIEYPSTKINLHHPGVVKLESLVVSMHVDEVAIALGIPLS